MTTKHADYAILAARIAISNLHKETKKVFSGMFRLFCLIGRCIMVQILFIDVMADLHNCVNEITKEPMPMISKEHNDIIQKHKDVLNSAIIYNRDFEYNYFGFKTLERSYLLKINKKVVERPQHMLMRVAVAIHMEDLDKVIETYNYLSERYFTHASPTLFSACTPRQQMSRYKITEIIIEILIN